MPKLAIQWQDNIWPFNRRHVLFSKCYFIDFLKLKLSVALNLVLKLTFAKLKAGMFIYSFRLILIFFNWEKQDQVWNSRLDYELCISARVHDCTGKANVLTTSESLISKHWFRTNVDLEKWINMVQLVQWSPNCWIG